ncbi:MAG: PHP domain-containing protein [Promethearchaeota archaeon]
MDYPWPLMDLHVHTTYSDGEASPGELAAEVAGKGVEVIAFTDHCDLSGTFMYTRGKPKPMSEYLAEIRQVAEDWKGKLEVLTGVEVTRIAGSEAADPAVAGKFANFDWILVDGVYIEGAPDRTIALADAVHDSGIKTPPRIGLAHPWFEALDCDVVGELAARGIALELNEQKICKRDFYAIERLLENFSKEELEFSIGSDAHARADAGACPITWDYAASMELKLLNEVSLKMEKLKKRAW